LSSLTLQLAVGLFGNKKKNKTKQNIYFAQFAPFGTSNVLSVRFVVYCHVLDLLRVECR
jgi:hypothetical protein